MKLLRYIYVLGVVFCYTLLPSCDVHEFPKEEPDVSLTLSLRYDQNMPLHKVVTYYGGTRAADSLSYGLRYIVKAYPIDENGTTLRTAAYEFVFTKEDERELNHTVDLLLKKGKYEFRVWTDYVLENTESDLYYNTQSFDAITFAGKEYEGSNDFKDAFVGSLMTSVSEDTPGIVIDMKRPLAKFNIVSTDLSAFISDMKVRAVGLDELNVLIHYQGFLPDEFNVFSDKPSDSCTGLSFKSDLKILNDNEAELGFDYVFVNGAESVIYISVDVLDHNGELLSHFDNVEVPLVRSKLTTIKADFLTSESDGGVTIVPDFDGEFNMNVE